MLKFIVDTQLPSSLAELLCSFDTDAIHTTSFPEGHLLDDKRILAIAIKENRIIVTKDTDFFEYFLLKGAPPKVLLIEFGNIKNSDLFKLFELHFKKIVDMLNKQADLIVMQRDNIIAY